MHENEVNPTDLQILKADFQAYFCRPVSFSSPKVQEKVTVHSLTFSYNFGEQIEVRRQNHAWKWSKSERPPDSGGWSDLLHFHACFWRPASIFSPKLQEKVRSCTITFSCDVGEKIRRQKHAWKWSKSERPPDSGGWSDLLHFHACLWRPASIFSPKLQEKVRSCTITRPPYNGLVTWACFSLEFQIS